MANEEIGFELSLRDKKFIAAMAKATQQVNKLDKSVKGIQSTANKSFQAKGALKFGAALVGVSTAALAVRKSFQLMSRVVASSLKDFAKFEKNMLAVRTLLDETSFAGKSAGEGFKQMGKDMTKVLQNIPIDANDATKALFDITSAQISAAEATGVLTAAGKLAVAGNARVSTTTAAVVKSIVSYGLEAKDATNIAAKFFTAQKLGLTTVEELSAGIGTVAANAAQMGVSLDETLAAVVGATRGGLGARRAFVGLGAALKSIAKPGKEAQAVADRLKIVMSKEGIAAKGGIIPFLQDLSKKLKGSTKDFATLFSSARSRRAIGSLLTESGQKGAIDSLDAMGDKTKNVTNLTDNYQIAVDGLSNQWDLLTGNLDIVKRALVGGLAPAFKDVLGDATESIKELFEEIQTPEVQQSLKTLGESIFTMFKALQQLTPEMSTFITALGGLLTIGKDIADTMISIGEGSEVSLTKAAKKNAELFNIQSKLKDLLEDWPEGERTPIHVEKAIELLKTRENTLKEEVRILVEQEKQIKTVAKMSAKEKSALDIRIKGLAKLSQMKKEAADKEVKALIKADAEATIANDNEIARMDKLSKEWAKQSKVLAKEHDKRVAVAEKAAESIIGQAKLIGKSELEQLSLSLAAQIRYFNDRETANTLSSDKAQEARLAAVKIFEDSKAAIEDKARDERAGKEKAFWDDFQSNAISAVGAIASAVLSGAGAEKGIREAKSAQSAAQGKLDALPQAITPSVEQKQRISEGEQNIESLKKKMDSISTAISNTSVTVLKEQLRLQKDKVKADLRLAKDRLVEDKKIVKESEAEADKRSKAIEDGVKDVEGANKAAEKAVNNRDEEAKNAVIGGLSAGANAFVPGLGAAVDPLLQIATQDPEDAAAFITALVDQIPKIVDGLIDNLPLIAEKLGEAMPIVALSLAESFGNPIFLAKIGIAFATGVLSGLGEVGKKMADMFINGVDILVRGATTFVNKVVEIIADILGAAIDGVVDGFFRVADAISEVIRNIQKALTGPADKVKAGASNFAEGVNDALGTNLATGGIVTGAGNRDTVPALLTPGELVVDRTTGPRLNKFLDSAEAGGALRGDSGGSQDVSSMLAEILSEVRKSIQVNTEVKINEDVFADLILDLNRRDARIA